MFARELFHERVWGEGSGRGVRDYGVLFKSSFIHRGQNKNYETTLLTPRLVDPSAQSSNLEPTNVYS